MEEWEWTPHLLLPSLHYSPCAEPIWGRVFEDDGRRGWGERDGTGDKEMRDRRKGPSPSHREKLAVHFVLIFLDSFEACVRKTTPPSLHRSVFPSRRSLPKSLPDKNESRRMKNDGGLRVREIVLSGASRRTLRYYLLRHFSLSRRACLLYRGNQMLHFWGTKWTFGGGGGCFKKFRPSFSDLLWVKYVNRLGFSYIHTVTRLYLSLKRLKKFWNR